MSDYNDDNILSCPAQDDSDAAVQSNFQAYPVIDYDPICFGQRYKGTISAYPGLTKQPYDYQKGQMPTPQLASGFDFQVWSPMNCQVSSMWISRLGEEAARLFKNDVGISLWNIPGKIDNFFKVTDIADDLGPFDIRIEPYMLNSIQGTQDDTPKSFSCVWYWATTWAISSRPRYLNPGPQQLPILQPPMKNSVQFMWQKTEAQYKNNIKHYESLGVKDQHYPYGMIGSTDDSLIIRDLPFDAESCKPYITRQELLDNRKILGTQPGSTIGKFPRPNQANNQPQPQPQNDQKKTKVIDGKEYPVCQAPKDDKAVKDSENRFWGFEQGVSCIYE